MTKTILLVEDNPDDVELTKRSLRDSKFVNKIDVARDGEEAIDFLFCRGAFSSRPRNNHPDLVLLDLELPRLNGLQVLESIRSNDSTRHIPVVILTCSKEESDIKRGYLLGANSFIRKPVAFDRFVQVVRQLEEYWLELNECS